MLLTYDRFLIKSFLHTFAVCFIATFGLYAVIDLFENLDEMIKLNGDNGNWGLITLIATLDGYRSILFIDRAGPILAVISVMTVLILLQRSGELHPLLAAGIPMYRILCPVIFAGASVNGLLIFNQEFLVPHVAFLEYELYHNDPSDSEVESLTDLSTGINIDGNHINVPQQTILNPSFLLPAPSIVTEITPVEAKTAKFYPATGKHAAGWCLEDVTAPPLSELSERLTDKGRAIVRFGNDPHRVFIFSPITCDQLFKRSSSYTSLSTSQLLDRIHCPAFGMITIHRLILYVHSRLVQPLMNIIAVLVTIPLMVRRESPGLVADSSLCGFILAVLFGVTQAFQSLGANHLIPPDLAAWGPVVIGGSLSAWLSGLIRT